MRSPSLTANTFPYQLSSTNASDTNGFDKATRPLSLLTLVVPIRVIEQQHLHRAPIIRVYDARARVEEEPRR